eukprot:CAMPEP_0174894476 /NCGR_PEP_ID=MMETSP0167-20121228/9117_1 /TAXON_ID=38298 /ORGANISM="Rhodella maculata, Strain CCMP736" /LENGTH=128 /DNA_ID=CAMNT_0016133579 /DNA_START=108 /DNA_END=495 /DNA_ORIENTATION=+
MNGGKIVSWAAPEFDVNIQGTSLQDELKLLSSVEKPPPHEEIHNHHLVRREAGIPLAAPTQPSHWGLGPSWFNYLQEIVPVCLRARSRGHENSGPESRLAPNHIRAGVDNVRRKTNGVAIIPRTPEGP